MFFVLKASAHLSGRRGLLSKIFGPPAAQGIQTAFVHHSFEIAVEKGASQLKHGTDPEDRNDRSNPHLGAKQPADEEDRPLNAAPHHSDPDLRKAFGKRQHQGIAGTAAHCQRNGAPVALVGGEPLRWGDYELLLLNRPAGDGVAIRPGEETVTVGPCSAGARLRLPGTRGGRTVKRLCLDRGIGLAERERMPAFYVGGQLAAVWPLGVDEAFLPEGEPCRFIKIIRETEENRDEQ